MVFTDWLLSQCFHGLSPLPHATFVNLFSLNSIPLYNGLDVPCKDSCVNVWSSQPVVLLGEGTLNLKDMVPSRSHGQWSLGPLREYEGPALSFPHLSAWLWTVLSQPAARPANKPWSKSLAVSHSDPFLLGAGCLRGCHSGKLTGMARSLCVHSSSDVHGCFCSCPVSSTAVTIQMSCFWCSWVGIEGA